MGSVNLSYYYFLCSLSVCLSVYLIYHFFEIRYLYAALAILELDIQTKADLELKEIRDIHQPLPPECQA